MEKSTHKPWDRREDETSKSYMAFCFYRDLGPSRSLPKAWELYKSECGLKAVYPTGTFKDWSRENDWVDRSKAWDDFEDKQRRAERDQARKEARDVFVKEAVELSRQLINVALGESEPNRDQVKAILKALDRAGVTVPKEVKLEHSGPDGGPIEVGDSLIDKLADMSPEEKADAFKDLIGAREDNTP